MFYSNLSLIYITHTHTCFCFLYFRLAFVKVMIAVHHWLWPCHVLTPFTISSCNGRWFKLCTILTLHFLNVFAFLTRLVRYLSFYIDPACVFLSRDTSPSYIPIMMMFTSRILYHFEYNCVKLHNAAWSCLFDVPSMQALRNANVSPEVPFWITSRTHQIAHHSWIWPTTPSISPTQLLYYSSWICFPCVDASATFALSRPLCCFSTSASTSICNHFLARSLSQLHSKTELPFVVVLQGNWTWFRLNIVLTWTFTSPFALFDRSVCISQFILRSSLRIWHSLSCLHSVFRATQLCCFVLLFL